LRQYQVALAKLAAFTSILLTACGGSNGTKPAPPAPVFTSTPVTQAVEGSAYTYQLTATGGTITFALTNAPAGATLSGNTISWTPTAAQSRVANSFTATATAPGSPSATQSWTVTPNGTVRVRRIDTFWNETGSTGVPYDWSRISTFIAALVPQPDGSVTSLPGTPGATGVFEIPDVPAGYFWLRLGPNEFYWTSSSAFDLGGDYFAAGATAPAPANSTTTFDFSFTSLDATTLGSWLQFSTPESPFLHYSGPTAVGSTTFTGSMKIGGNIDYSGIHNAFVMQYEPAAFGSVSGYVLGPELSLTDLSVTTGGTNTISGSLDPTVPASMNLSVEGSAWTPLLDHVAPSAPTSVGGGFYASVQPYIAADGPNVGWSVPINLLGSPPDFGPGVSTCSSSSASFGSIRGGDFSGGTIPPPFTTDVDAGTVQYNDPFPAAWRRTFCVCLTALVGVPVPGTSTTESFFLTNSQTTSLPTDTVKPLISPVQNPKLNGADIFTPNTISGSPLTLNWNPPAIGTPFGYQVTIEGTTTLPDGSVSYAPLARLSTAMTSMTIPPGLLKSGQTYFFMITSFVDGKANMETSPNRSLLPVANADLISAPQTIAAQSN
jgi:hypothetical protein